MMDESKKIYGVDLSKEITPIMVRDAMIRCFSEAHKCLDVSGGDVECAEDLKKVRDMNAEIFVKKCFEKAGGNFENPKKDDFVNVINRLAEFSASFRDEETIERHKSEMAELINRLK
jgi:hypothetical protein